jgi:hypothetical protein
VIEPGSLVRDKSGRAWEVVSLDQAGVLYARKVDLRGGRGTRLFLASEVIEMGKKVKVSPAKEPKKSSVKDGQEANVKVYRQKDLGYKRVETFARLRVRFRFENGLLCFDVPAQLIADDRDTHYASEQEDTVKYLRSGQLSYYNLKEWASKKMNWADLEEWATRVELVPTEPDLESLWCNASKDVEGEV